MPTPTAPTKDKPTSSDNERLNTTAESSGTHVPDALDQIAQNLTDTMPEVQRHAIDQERQQQDERQAKFSELRDSDGQPFDPSVHKTDRDGNPTISTLGKLIKKPGRKPGSSATKSTIGGASIIASAGPAPDQVARMQARQCGNMAANLLMQIGVVAGGDEWYPREDKATGLNEKTMLETAFGDYFEAAGIIDIPPGFALTLAIGGYALPRFMMPKTKTRAQRGLAWVKKWWINRKLKKHGMQVEESEKSEKTEQGKMAA
jgi:hypothetical protein